jgi:hypothetical protein
MRRRRPEPKLRPDQAENEKEECADHGIEVSCNPKPRQRGGRDCQAYEKTQQEKKQTELEHATRLLRHDLSFECCPQQRGLTDGRSAVAARHPTTLRLDYGCAGGPLGHVSCARLSCGCRGAHEPRDHHHRQAGLKHRRTVAAWITVASGAFT